MFGTIVCFIAVMEAKRKNVSVYLKAKQQKKKKMKILTIVVVKCSRTSLQDRYHKLLRYI